LSLKFWAVVLFPKVFVDTFYCYYYFYCCCGVEQPIVDENLLFLVSFLNYLSCFIVFLMIRSLDRDEWLLDTGLNWSIKLYCLLCYRLMENGAGDDIQDLDFAIKMSFGYYKMLGPSDFCNTQYWIFDIWLRHLPLLDTPLNHMLL